MANYCKSCGKPLSPENNFCPNCGQPLDGAPTITQASYKAPQAATPPLTPSSPYSPYTPSSNHRANFWQSLRMKWKPITVIAVLVLLASLLVAGYTIATGPPSTDYPTSGRSKLVEGAVKQTDSYKTGATRDKLQAYVVTWLSNTKANVHVEHIDTQTFAVTKRDITISHFPTTNEAYSYYLSKIQSTYIWTKEWTSSPVDYYKLTNKAPTTFNVAHDDWGDNGVAQYDTLVVEMTYAITAKT